SKKAKNARHRGKLLPLQAGLVEAMNSLRDQVRRTVPTEKRDQVQPMFGRDLVQFGKILGHWQELVGPDVSEHAWPVQLMHGRLALVCSDSQWLHHLRFLKNDILQNVKQRFPGIPLQEIYGKVGSIPAHAPKQPEMPWPTWEQEPEPELPEQVSPELRERISRCARKSEARLKGFLEHGFKVCPACRSAVIPDQSTHCGVCLFRQRDTLHRRVRVLLSDQPWYSFEQVHSEIPESSHEEYDIIRRELILEARDRITILGQSWVETADREVRAELEREIIRELMLASQIAPNQISLSDPSIMPLLDPEWITWLNTRFDEGSPC
ncbi:MAG TPA: DUF721 domain-containing protein, partial [Candidatus Ozemobacteraceae bacterium]|nr:DUF721 domain-containing protein [Candidatus Ozemobacteraceae bacterium]